MSLRGRDPAPREGTIPRFQLGAIHPRVQTSGSSPAGRLPRVRRPVPAPDGAAADNQRAEQVQAAKIGPPPVRRRLVHRPRLVELLDGTLSDASFLGDQVIYTVTLADGRRLLVKERNPGDGSLRAAGSAIGLAWDAQAGVILGRT